MVLLAKHFAAQFGKELRGSEATLSDAALAAIRAHNWPGNVRELENAIERGCILTDSMVLEPRDLGLVRKDGSEGQRGFDLSGTLADVAQRAVRSVERSKIAEALRTNDGNKSRAAEDLGVSYKTLLTKIKDYDL